MSLTAEQRELLLEWASPAQGATSVTCVKAFDGPAADSSSHGAGTVPN